MKSHTHEEEASLLGFLKKRQPDEPESDSPLTVCIVSAMVIVAIADGKLSQAEKEIIVQFLAAFSRGAQSPSEVLQQIQSTIDLFDERGEMVWLKVMSLGRTLPVELKREVMDWAGTIAIIEGELHPREEELVCKIAEWIEMPKPDFDIWQRELERRLEERR